LVRGEGVGGALFTGGGKNCCQGEELLLNLISRKRKLERDSAGVRMRGLKRERLSERNRGKCSRTTRSMLTNEKGLNVKVID